MGRPKRREKLVPLRIMITPEQFNFVVGKTEVTGESMGSVVRQLIKQEIERQKTVEGM